jgi:hypothetical protein
MVVIRGIEGAGHSSIFLLMGGQQNHGSRKMFGNIL